MGNSHRGFESHALRMGHLIYSVITSLDGYVNDAEGGFAWAMPDDDVHAYVNDEMRPVGTHLYGRRLYEVMAGWQTFGTSPEEPAVVRDFGELWRAADKVVYSTTLSDVSTPRTTLEHRFDPDAVRALVARDDRDVSVGGPGLAEHALRAGLVDEVGVVLAPVVVGGGTPYLPPGLRVDLRLLDERRFANGFVALRYAVGR
jgi:dihydrofolate reductase